MILYKYFNVKNGEEFLENRLINFTPPQYFNDPFEVTSTYPCPTDSELVLERKHATDEIYRTQYYVLCLTRSPLNKLMWAHYADDHKGLVIGIDVNWDFFTNKKTCTIPVQFGNVIYTATKPQTGTIKCQMSPRYDFPTYSFDDSEALQRLFLYKSIDWAYEEEVRIVKYFGKWGLHPGPDDVGEKEKKKYFQIEDIEDDDSKRVKLKIPIEAIKEIYIGVRNTSSDRKLKLIAESYSEAQFIRCSVDPFNWNLRGDMILS